MAKILVWDYITGQIFQINEEEMQIAQSKINDFLFKKTKSDLGIPDNLTDDLHAFLEYTIGPNK